MINFLQLAAGTKVSFCCADFCYVLTMVGLNSQYQPVVTVQTTNPAFRNNRDIQCIFIGSVNPQTNKTEVNVIRKDWRVIIYYNKTYAVQTQPVETAWVETLTYNLEVF